MNLIEAKEIRKQFHNREVVKGINLEIRQGEILALIGTNGAGKSTTLAMLLGILPPDAGTITRWSEDYKAHIGVQLQSTPFFEGYSTEENLRIFAALYNVRMDKEQIQAKLEECNLQEARKTLASRLSGGQQKRLAIAVTTLHNPDLIILDEPAAGLDPRARHEVRAMIERLAENNVTVLFSSHDMEEVSRIAGRIILMHEGLIVAQGEPEHLLQEYHAENLESLYLELTDSVEAGGK
ncbi:ABC transporter ATP-binding protein [Faecalispora sporosphaeroides]|uniref:ABC transporter ATP-binding protein n=1 Tax=Faecalispora sporosphaeroides TaxID=1549 RepID=UPI000375747E|nr:ABC transporter ATP-binding protein [Faecalispora sporosphaeroides]